MTFPTLGTPGSSQETVNTLNHDIVLPAGLTTGNLLILAISCDGIPTLTIPSFWTQLGNGVNTTTNRLYVGYGFVDGNEDNDLVWESSASEQSSTRVWEVTGAHASTPPECSVVTAGASVNPDWANLDPAGWATEDTLWMAFCGCDAVSILTVAPTNYGSIETLAAGGSTGASLSKCHRNGAIASDNPATGTININDQWATFLIAIRPAGAAEVLGAAAGAFGFTGTALGQAETLGAAAGAFGFTGTALGVVSEPEVTGAASGAFGFTGTALGQAETLGAAAGAFGFTGTALGVPTTPGLASGAFGFTGTALGVVVGTVNGAASGAFGFTGTALGVPTTPGAAQGAFGFTATALGVVVAENVAQPAALVGAFLRAPVSSAGITDGAPDGVGVAGGGGGGW